MTFPARDPLPPPLAWAITWRDPAGAEPVTELLDPGWCHAAGYQPDQVADPIRAAWCLALLLGSQDHEDADLIAITAVEPP